LHQTRFEIAQKPYTFETSAATMADVLAIIGAVRKLKSEQQLSLKTELHELRISSKNVQSIERLKEHLQLIKGVTQAQLITFTQAEQITALMIENEKAVATVTL
jgi:valyl-tRNA synthetase